MSKTTFTNMQGQPNPINTIRVTNAEETALGVTFLANVDVRPYVVYNTDLQVYRSWNGSVFQNIGMMNWQPPVVPLGSVLENGVGTFFNNGSGIFYSLDNTGDSTIYFNCVLKSVAGVEYDGSNLAVKLICRKSIAGNGTVGLILSSSILKDGENSQTKVTISPQQDTVVDGWTANLQNNIILPTINGVIDGKVLQVSIERNSGGAGADTYNGDLNITGIEIIKV